MKMSFDFKIELDRLIDQYQDLLNHNNNINTFVTLASGMWIQFQQSILKSMLRVPWNVIYFLKCLLSYGNDIVLDDQNWAWDNEKILK